MTIATFCTEGTAFLKGASSSAALDCELLLVSVLKVPRETLLAHRDRLLAPAELRVAQRLLQKRREGVPLPYLTGGTEFFGRAFVVTPAVLIPRPETEAAITEALHVLRETPREKGERGPLVADIGTGSGVLAVTIALEDPRVHVVAVDRSRAALALARRNARRQRVLRRIAFFESDLLNTIPREWTPRLILANLPYVPSDHLKRAGDRPETRGLSWEPQQALDGGPDGLYVIRRFLSQFSRFPHLRPTLNALILEHDPAQYQRIVEMASDALPHCSPHRVTPFVTRWSRHRRA